jgi:hypothetical protein
VGTDALRRSSVHTYRQMPSGRFTCSHIISYRVGHTTSVSSTTVDSSLLLPLLVRRLNSLSCNVCSYFLKSLAELYQQAKLSFNNPQLNIEGIVEVGTSEWRSPLLGGTGTNRQMSRVSHPNRDYETSENVLLNHR